VLPPKSEVEPPAEGEPPNNEVVGVVVDAPKREVPEPRPRLKEGAAAVVPPIPPNSEVLVEGLLEGAPRPKLRPPPVEAPLPNPENREDEEAPPKRDGVADAAGAAPPNKEGVEEAPNAEPPKRELVLEAVVPPSPPKPKLGVAREGVPPRPKPGVAVVAGAVAPNKPLELEAPEPPNKEPPNPGVAPNALWVAGAAPPKREVVAPPVPAKSPEVAEG